jgi:hypothetical protein
VHHVAGSEAPPPEEEGQRRQPSGDAMKRLAELEITVVRVETDLKRLREEAGFA